MNTYLTGAPSLSVGLEQLRVEMDRTLEAGGRLFIHEELLSSEGPYAALRARHGDDAGAVHRFSASPLPPGRPARWRREWDASGFWVRGGFWVPQVLLRCALSGDEVRCGCPVCARVWVWWGSASSGRWGDRGRASAWPDPWRLNRLVRLLRVSAPLLSRPLAQHAGLEAPADLGRWLREPRLALVAGGDCQRRREDAAGAPEHGRLWREDVWRAGALSSTVPRPHRVEGPSGSAWPRYARHSHHRSARARPEGSCRRRCLCGWPSSSGYRARPTSILSGRRSSIRSGASW